MLTGQRQVYFTIVPKRVEWKEGVRLECSSESGPGCGEEKEEGRTHTNQSQRSVWPGFVYEPGHIVPLAFPLCLPTVQGVSRLPDASPPHALSRYISNTDFFPIKSRALGKGISQNKVET